MDREIIGTVLVVDDNLVNQQVAQLTLEHLGYTAEVVSSASEAFELLEARQYAAILMDCHMPNMDGYEATRQIRGRYPERRVPIIALTANANTGDRERCLDAGMSDYLEKPVRPADLGAMLQRWVGSIE